MTEQMRTASQNGVSPGADDFAIKLAEYRARVPAWSDAKFQAAVDQAADEQPNDDDFWAALSDFLDGSMPLSYYR